jgi:proline iminopeptidase
MACSGGVLVQPAINSCRAISSRYAEIFLQTSAVLMALFPLPNSYRQSLVPVGQGHQLYVEESGNPNGVPVIVLHGGPGGGCSPFMGRFFDPRRFRIILFDQRGRGQSRPFASTSHNTTSHLIADLESLREALGVERWRVFGGSWGVTLALAYLAAHPQRVVGMVLRGVFLCRQQDRDWLYTSEGAARLFPEEWAALQKQAPPGEGSLLQRYHQGLKGDRARYHARSWCNWESTLALTSVLPSGEASDDELCMAMQETHYFLHDGFLTAPLLEACAGMTLPVEMVHGTRDFVCPADQALALHQVLPGSRLHWVEGGSHSSSDPAISNALMDAVNRLEKRIDD